MINIYQHHVHMVIVVILQQKNQYQIINYLKREQDIIRARILKYICIVPGVVDFLMMNDLIG